MRFYRSKRRKRRANSRLHPSQGIPRTCKRYSLTGANGSVANTAFRARSTPWTAPAERSGDGALDRTPTTVATPTSLHAGRIQSGVALRFPVLGRSRFGRGRDFVEFLCLWSGNIAAAEG